MLLIDRGASAVPSDRKRLIPDTCRCRTAGPGPEAGQDGAAPARLAHLYLCEELSTYRIAQLTGLDRQRVTRLLRRTGVQLRPRGAGGTRPERRRGDPANLPGILAGLYVRQHLTTPQIAMILGIPDRTQAGRMAVRQAAGSSLAGPDQDRFVMAMRRGG